MSIIDDAHPSLSLSLSLTHTYTIAIKRNGRNNASDPLERQRCIDMNRPTQAVQCFVILASSDTCTETVNNKPSTDAEETISVVNTSRSHTDHRVRNIAIVVVKYGSSIDPLWHDNRIIRRVVVIVVVHDRG